jgi:hypothetical protein
MRQNKSWSPVLIQSEPGSRRFMSQFTGIVDPANC